MRAGGRAFAAAVLVLAALGVAARPAAATSPLEGITAALEREADRLERLTSGPRVGGPDWAVDVQVNLTVVEVRVWRWRTAVAEVLAGRLGAAVGEQVPSSGGALSSIPALGLLPDDAEAARLRPVLEDWAEYRRALSRVLDLMAGLRAAAAPGTAGLLPPGRVCPVAGPHHFEHTWAKLRPWGRAHRGEDVHAEPGTPLVAIESGTIVQSGWHWSGGYGVYLEGYYSGDVYYYAHMAWLPREVRPGVVVRVGDLLGWVGRSGNATSPHLHLGWIPDNPGRWVDLDGLADPYPLLVGLCGSG
ncbi:MAG: M23 family metallopeptidase [Acidimicrobiia bacterium]|nr:M23 family metallopeptidase [Acidimicrobiia bacterium]